MKDRKITPLKIHGHIYKEKEKEEIETEENNEGYKEMLGSCFGVSILTGCLLIIYSIPVFIGILIILSLVKYLGWL